MSEVRLGANESFESLMRRFRKAVDNSGVLSEIRRREAFETPSERRRRRAARRRLVLRRVAQREQ